MFEKLKQFKDLRNQAKTLQETLKTVTVHADADGGKVQVVMDGNQQIIGLEIDPEYLHAAKQEELQKHIAEAVNSAVKKSQIEMAKKVKEMNISLPPGF
ncbi:MAG: YbaB/EbfC family nucleoid-associated protein [Candidatus Kerfeldbacteria bacterium]|nr:YbaB/EbfC family nucleoid-associated protein [Candidatus Kerfeldbacteria bacterium]